MPDPTCLSLMSESDSNLAGSGGAPHRRALWPSWGIYFRLIFLLSQREYLKPSEVNCRKEAKLRRNVCPERPLICDALRRQRTILPKTGLSEAPLTVGVGLAQMDLAEPSAWHSHGAWRAFGC